MVIHNLSPGDYTVTFTATGHDTLICEFTLLTDGTMICNTITGCGCVATPPGMIIEGLIVRAFLKPTGAPPTNIDEWNQEKGGSAGLSGNYQAVAEIIDGFIEIQDVGFKVQGADVANVIDYVLGLK